MALGVVLALGGGVLLHPHAAQTLPGQVPGGYAYTRYLCAAATDSDLLERWIIHGMNHAWSGGSTAGSYTDPAGPNASQAIVTFFLSHSH